MAMAWAWWTIMSCMKRTSSASTGPEGRGATAAPVRAVLGSPGRPGRITGALGEVTAAVAPRPLPAWPPPA
jgi:hypothetical protein